MLKTSIGITLTSVDEKATLKIKKTIDKAADRIAKKFGKKAKLQAKEASKTIKGKKKKLVPAEPTVQ